MSTEFQCGKNRALKIVIAVAISVSIFQTCSSHIETTHEKTGRANTADTSLILRCKNEDFAQTGCEHMFVDIERPFVVRTIKGNIINAQLGVSPEDVGWSKDWPVIIQVRPISGKGRISSACADEKGFFEIRDMPEGLYCFKAAICGWETVMGVIFVNKTASLKTQIIFKMHFDW